MGQYHLTVNLDRREYLNPHKLGMGLKLWEQTGDMFAKVMVPLLAVSNGRGGGDFNDGNVMDTQIIGRWGGNRIAIVGDYATAEDLPAELDAATIYRRCADPSDFGADEDTPDYLYTDITDVVCKFVEDTYGGVFYGDGWRRFITPGPCERWGAGHDKIAGVVRLASRSEGIVIDWENCTTDTVTPRQLRDGHDSLPYMFQ